MNVIINEKLIEDSQKIDLGIRRLQSKISNVIDRITDKDADPKSIIENYKDELEIIKTELSDFLQEQEKFDQTVKDAEKEITMVGEEVKKMMEEHNINFDDVDPNKDNQSQNETPKEDNQSQNETPNKNNQSQNETP